MDNIKITELKTNLFEELSDEQSATVVGGQQTGTGIAGVGKAVATFDPAVTDVLLGLGLQPAN